MHGQLRCLFLYGAAVMLHTRRYHQPHVFTLTIHGTCWRCRNVPAFMPPFWVPLGIAGFPLTVRRLRVWSYVLQALRLPHIISGSRARDIWVPVLLERLCAVNLREYENESGLRGQRVPPADEPFAWLACLSLLPVLFAHALRFLPSLNGLAQAFGFPADPAAWPELLGCDNVRMLLFMEWDRSCTGLFVHADGGHLAANAAFTVLFARLLAGHVGWGLTALLTIWSGALGNAAAALLRNGFTLSIGFSTALFACVGALSGFVSLYSRPRAVLPLAAGLAILAMLGTEGENTDYLAHCAGLICGMVTGLLTALACRRLGRVPGQLWQAVCLVCALALPLLCFSLRLRAVPALTTCTVLS